jgi:class 3 adenylate cyclase
VATRLRPLLEPFDGDHVVIGSVAYWGAVSRYLGLLDHLLGDLDGAVARLRTAEREHQSMRSPPWVARTRYDLARVLVDRDGAGDRADARRLLDDALGTARTIGATRLVEQALHEKITLQGLSGSDPGTSIDVVAAAAASDRYDVSDRASSNGRVTVAFSDIEGYTALTERVGDARSQQILHDHNDIVRGALRTRRGTEVKSQGDGFMVVFDRPEAAALWAGDVHLAMAAHDFGTDVTGLAVRIGMHEGSVISEEDDFYGRTVIMAARVAAQAPGGDTLITDHLRRLLDASVGTFGPPVDVELKGMRGTHTLIPLTT